MPKRLIFVENRQDAETLVEDGAFARILPDSIIYVFDKDAEKVLMERAVAYKTPEQILSVSDYEGLDKDAIHFAKRWHHLGEIANGVTYNGICLAGLIERDMAFFFSVILDAIAVSRKVITYERPDEVCYFERNYADAAHSVKPGRDETYYGYFAGYFAPKVTGFRVNSSVAGEDIAVCPNVIYIDANEDRAGKGKKNILWTNDAEYLDMPPALAAALGRSYVIKHLRVAKGLRVYRIDSIKDPVVFDFSPLKSFFAHEGVNFFDVVSYKMRHLQLEAFPFLKALIRTLIEILEKERIDCLVASEDAMAFNKTAVSVANGIGIPTVVLQKGLCAHAISYIPVTADKFAAWGQSAKDYLVNGGVSPDKIELVGSPRFQSYRKKSLVDEKERQGILRELGLDGKHDRLFLLTLQHGNREALFRNIHVTFHEELKIVRLLSETMRPLKRDVLCIKFHPQDKLGAGILRYLGADIPSNVKTVEHYPIEKILKVTDTLITCFSTTALEALLMDIPVVVINLFSRPFNMDFTKEGVAAGVYNENDLMTVMSDTKKHGAYSDEEKERFLSHQFFRKNTEATERLARLIDNVVLEKNRRRHEDIIH